MTCKYKKRNIAASSQYEDLMHQVRCSEKESRNRTKKHPDSLINVATKLQFQSQLQSGEKNNVIFGVQKKNNKTPAKGSDIC